MKKYHIHDTSSLQEYLKTVTTPIIGIGARPYHATIGVRKLFPHFELLSCKGTTKETPLLEKQMKITYLIDNKDDFINLTNYQAYQTTSPSDILKDAKILRYLDSFKEKPALLFFKLTPLIEELMSKNDYLMVGSSYPMYEKYENKINFQSLVDQLGIPTPEHTVVAARNLDYNTLQSVVGSQFVIQLPSLALGSGTFFVLKKNDLAKITNKEVMREAIAKNSPLKITRFIDRVCAPSMTVCVTKFGVLYTNLQKQIIDAQEVMEKSRRSGVYCGHDWTQSNFSQDIQDQADSIADKIGHYLKDKEHFRGIFGIDFVLERGTGQLYPIEANVRLLGSFPMLSMVQASASQPLIQALQILDSLPRDDYDLDIAALNRAMSGYKVGAHLNIHTKTKEPVYVSGNVKPGIYQVDQTTGKIVYLREGVFFEDLKNDNEVLLASGIPKKGRVFLRHQAICKIISRHSLIDDNDKLNAFAKLMVKYTYKKLALRKVKSIS